MTDQLAGLLAEQARYYRERAGEYDDWWFRRGRYDRGADANARWFAEVAEVLRALFTMSQLQAGRATDPARS